MRPQQAGEFEHPGAVFAEDGAQLVIGHDHALVGGVLQVVGLDVVPQLFHRLRARYGLVADDGSELGAGLLATGGGGLARGFGGGCLRGFFWLQRP